MKELFKRVDLGEYLERFESFLARPKELFLDGDNKVNYEQILELSKFEIDPPKNIQNLDDPLMRLSKFAVLHISEIYEFSKIINYFNYIKRFEFEGTFCSWLIKIEIPSIITKISNYFDDEGRLKDEVDERFYSLKEAYRIKKDAINSELKKLLYSKNLAPYLVDTQIHYINESETLLVRGGFNHALKGQVVGRSSGGYFYITPNSISKLKSEQSEILSKTEEIVYEYCKEISSVFNKNLQFLKFINRAFDRLDNLLARAFLAKSADLDFVLNDSSKDIIIKDFAHPALKKPKPESLNFSKKVLLITGVNAGGKSMLLKSILSVALLSRYLLPMKIDAKDSKIGTFKEFELIMEDPQDAKNDISTFAGRMLSFSKLFGRKELLLGVDEIELGTDFEEAASLYSVMIEQLLKGDTKIVITTHHKRLAMLLSKNEEVELVAALYDEKQGVPKFEFLEGTIGKSYAFETAIRYKIPPNLVAKAKEVYGVDKENLNEAITKTLNLELELREKISQTTQKDYKLDKLLESLKDQKAKVDAELESTTRRLEMEYYEAISEAKRGINLKDTKDKQRSINRANELVKAVKKPEKRSSSYEFKVGDYAKYGNIKGEIVGISKKEATIISDGLKLRVGLNLLKPSYLPQTDKKQNIKIDISRPQNASIMLDLHGLRVDEALIKLDKFISDSLLLGFDE
ncbi:MAG: endonuclease MutS2, partial [Campylobacter sp.]|nr:endonuclease MutS2 [Campylobacter sp.]